MAIKIIKHGKKSFKVTCPVCGCEFEYTYEDIQTVSDPNSITYGATVKVVECPECKEKLGHNDYIYPTAPVYPTWPTYPWPSIPTYPTYPYVTWCNTELDCEKCPNRPDPNKIIVGDTPCTWCRKNQPYCTSSSLGGKAEYNVDYKTDPNTLSTATYTYTTSTTSFVEDKPEKAEEK
jgi:hypothetical protein